MTRSRLYGLSAAASLLAVVPGFAVRAGPPVPGNDYPTESLKAGEQGTVWYKVDVTETGVPENCVIVVSSGYPRLDKATCDLVLRRARFKPARSPDGTAIRSSFSNKINWTIPAN